MSKMFRMPVMALLATSAAVIFTGCGGGGSGGIISGSGGLPAVNDAVAAEPTAANGAEAADTLQEQKDVGEAVPILAVSDEQTIGFDALKFALKQKDILQKSHLEDTHALNEAFSESYACDDGGSMSIAGSVTETSANVTMTASNCQEDGATMNGKIRMLATGTDYGDTLSYMKMSFVSDYTYTATGSDTMILHQGSYMEMDISSYAYDGNSMSGTLTSSVWFEAGSAQARYDDLKIDFAYDWNSGTDCYRSGRIYINNITEYLDIDPNYDASCSYPFTTSNSDLISGSTEFIGSNGNTVHVEVTSTNTITVADGTNTETVTVD